MYWIKSQYDNKLLTHEDGLVVSLSAALKMSAYRKSLEKRIIDSEADVHVEPLMASEQFILKEYDKLIRMVKTDENGEIIPAPFVSKGVLGKSSITSETIQSGHRGIITYVERRYSTDTKDMLLTETLAKYRLEVGSKLTDKNSHKGTVAKILPDWQMPEAQIPGTNRFQRLDIICPSPITKRCTPSREMEEIASLIAFKTGKRYVSKMTDTLVSIQKTGTNISPTIYNINPGNEYAMLALKVPVGFIAFAVLDQNPCDKLRYSNKINTNYQGRTKRGQRNYNFTDGLFPMIQCDANLLIEEIQGYAIESNNMHILRKNLGLFGFSMTGKDIIVHPKGIFKDREDCEESFILEKGFAKTDPDATITDTIYDPELEDLDISIKLPAGIPLFVTEIVKGLGSKTVMQEHGYKYLQRKDIQQKMKTWKLPFAHVYNNGKTDKYLKIPGFMLHTHTDYSGENFASSFMNKINSLILILNNTIKMSKYKIKQSNYTSQIVRCNIIFNDIVNSMILETVQKSGILRETLSPRLPYSIYGVASGTADYPVNEIRLPAKAIINFAESERFRKSYGIPDGATPGEIIRLFNSSKFRCVQMRQPCHGRNNISSFYIKVWNNNTIGIHNAAIAVEDGDLDRTP